MMIPVIKLMRFGCTA